MVFSPFRYSDTHLASEFLTRLFHELLWRDHVSVRATGQSSRGTSGLDLRRTRMVRRRVTLSCLPRAQSRGAEPKVQPRTTDFSGLESLELGKKDGHIGIRSRPFAKHPG